MGGKDLFPLTVYGPSLKLKQELKEEPGDKLWSRDYRGLLLPGPLSGLLSYFSNAAQPIYVEMVLPVMGWALLHQLSVKNMLPQTFPKTNWVEVISQLSSLFLVDSSLCQVGETQSVPMALESKGMMKRRKRTYKLGFGLQTMHLMRN